MVLVCTLSKSRNASPSSAATSISCCCISRISASLRPYLRASTPVVSSWPWLRRGRVELEGAVDDLHVVAVVEAGQGGLQAALADVAPGADDVGPDLDTHDSYNVRTDPDIPDPVDRHRPTSTAEPA